MRYQPLPPEFHAANRQKLAQSIGPEAIAIIDTADVLRRRGDFEYPFRPDSNFYYLTGIDEPEAVLLLAPGHPNEHLREILFLRETDDTMALWTGPRLSKKAAAERSGVQAVLDLNELKNILKHLTRQFHTIYVNADAAPEPGPLGPAARRASFLRQQLPEHKLKSCLDFLGNQRTIKAPAEIAQIRQAIEMTRSGLEKAYATLGPNLPEYDLSAELLAEFTRRGATGPAFSSIVAAGKNATIIHATPGDSLVQKNDLVLFDTAAEAGYYAADISRTVPASGHFTPRQRAVYEAVYRAQQIGIALHKPGATILSIDAAMRKHLIKELVALQLITPAQAKGSSAAKHLHKYYPHISHHLGLDVHDTGDSKLTFAPGMVVTCEPGLYLAEEGIGVRLEDDILITSTGHEVLSGSIPSAPDDIEHLIARAS